MSNHPNRGAGPKPCRNPKPDEIRRVREAAGLTQAEAAELVCSSLRSWENWEQPREHAEHRRMPAGIWKLFEYELGLRALPKTRS